MSFARFISRSIKTSTATLGVYAMQTRLFTTPVLTPQQMLAAARARQEATHKKTQELQQKLDITNNQLTLARIKVSNLESESKHLRNSINDAQEYSCDELIPLFAKKFADAGSTEFYEELKITSVTGTPYYLTLTLETKKPCMMNNFMREKGILPELVGSIERDRADSGMIIQKITLKEEYSRDHYRAVLEALIGESLAPEPENNSPSPSSL